MLKRYSDQDGRSAVLRLISRRKKEGARALLRNQRVEPRSKSVPSEWDAVPVHKRRSTPQRREATDADAGSPLWLSMLEGTVFVASGVLWMLRGLMPPYGRPDDAAPVASPHEDDEAPLPELSDLVAESDLSPGASAGDEEFLVTPWAVDVPVVPFEQDKVERLVDEEAELPDLQLVDQVGALRDVPPPVG
ncbi:MAG: hypothetical protein H7831_06320 [Magnetococcus sp. WYHC-3]